MMNVTKIYVITTASLLQQINIRRYRKNIQHSMLAHTDLNNVSIDNYKQEIFTTFMLPGCVFFTCLMN